MSRSPNISCVSEVKSNSTSPFPTTSHSVWSSISLISGYGITFSIKDDIS